MSKVDRFQTDSGYHEDVSWERTPSFTQTSIQLVDRRDRRPEFLRDGYDGSDHAPLVLRERGTETFTVPVERGPRSSNPVQVREIRREGERERSPPPPRRIFQRIVERERSLSPPTRIRERIIERERSPSPPPRVRERIIERERSPSPPPRVRERIIERERSPSPPTRIRERSIERFPSPHRERERYRTVSRHRVTPKRGGEERERESAPIIIDQYRVTKPVDEVIWDLSRTKDVTMHLELDVTEDLEPDLDEFCRLCRLGNFHLAKHFFRDNLEQHMDNPYVIVQYAQMLLEMGDYKSVMALNISDSLGESENQLLQTNWRVIQSLSAVHTGGWLEENELHFADEAALAAAFMGRSESERARGKINEAKVKLDRLRDKMSEAARTHNYAEVSDLLYYTIPDQESAIKSLEEQKAPAEANETSSPGSTECQILNLLSRVFAYVHHTAGTFDWEMLYDDMLRQGRIWDFRDIFIAAVLYYGQERACGEVFGSSAPVSLDKIILDWSTATYQESTSLALVDTLVSLVLARPLAGNIIAVKRWVDKAGDLASSIVQNDPGNLKSRQYIRWVLAKIAVKSHRDVLSSRPLSELSGLFLKNGAALDLYIYVPAASETPDWHLLSLSSKSYETQQMVLKAARQIEDLETEALCLKQLIVHSQDLIQYFDELIHLQKTVQGDMEGWLRTSLSKYIICRDKKSRDGLREEILSVSDFASLDAELVWARNMILRALANSEHEANLALDEARSSLHKPSQDIVDFMTRNELVTVNVPQAKMQSSDRLPMMRGSTDKDFAKKDPNIVTFSEGSTLGLKESTSPDLGRGKEPITVLDGEVSIQKGAESPQQKLSEIYVTIDEDAPEPEAVKPMIEKDKKQNEVPDTLDREQGPEVSNTRRPPAVSVSSAQEEVVSTTVG